jgi:hypothetical protein
VRAASYGLGCRVQGNQNLKAASAATSLHRGKHHLEHHSLQYTHSFRHIQTVAVASLTLLRGIPPFCPWQHGCSAAGVVAAPSASGKLYVWNSTVECCSRLARKAY